MTEKRHKKILHIAPREWDMRPMGLVGELKALLDAIKDAGTEIDTGTGNGNADLWVMVDGIEFYINVRRSNRQLKLEQPKGET